MRLPLPVLRRRALLMLAACAAAAHRARASTAALPQWPVQVLAATTEAVRQLHAGGPSGLLALGAQGTLWALSLTGAAPQPMARGLDPETAPASGHGRIVARGADGGLWFWERGVAHTAERVGLAAHAGFLVLPAGVIATVLQRGEHRLVRLEPEASQGWAEVARSAEAVLPDARPLQADLDGLGDGGHVVVLGGPDAERYAHGVLGDAIEATRLLYLERHSLRVMRELTLAPPFVIEDIAPRPVALGRRSGLLTMRSGPAGAQLMLVAADAAHAGRLRIEALGEPLGTRNRWLAASTDGQHWLAVHTPHIGGVLHHYRRDGERLLGRAVGRDVSTHHIGTREIDLAVWLGRYVVVPNQEGRRLRVLDALAGWAEVAAASLPGRVESAVALPGGRGLAARLDDGRVAIVRLPAG